MSHDLDDNNPASHNSTLGTRLSEFVEQNKSHKLFKPVDQQCWNKSIPLLLALGTPEALQLKQDIIQSSQVRCKDETPKSPPTSMQADFICYPSVKAGGLSSLDWGLVHVPNRNWVLQGKVDGSQLSFCSNNEGTELFMACGQKPCFNNKMFREARAALSTILKQLDPRLVYHAEFVHRLRHNITVVERLPRYFVQIYDIQEKTSQRSYSEHELEEECARIGLETVQLFWDNERCIGTCSFLLNKTAVSEEGYVLDPVHFAHVIIDAIMQGLVPAALGGIFEGLVFKHRSYFDIKRKGTSSKRSKFVTEDFKESRSVKKPQPPVLSVTKHIQWIGSLFDTPARFRKAFQRLRDSNVSDDEKQELSHSMPFIQNSLDQDLEKEAKAEIISYLTGDFAMRCVRGGEDVDTLDLKLAKVQELGKDASDDQVWNAFKADVFDASRVSLESWLDSNSTRDWISNLF